MIVFHSEKTIFARKKFLSVVIKDSVILETLQNNSNADGDLLFERYYKPLVLFADSMVSNLVDSEDLVQGVFIGL